MTIQKSRRHPASATAKARRREQHAERIEALHAELKQQVAAMVDSEQWRAFLRFTGAFHHYSVNNIMLILAQRPTATQVAGYVAWQRLGRQVRKDEKGIRIFGRPGLKKITETDPATGEETVRMIRCRPPVVSVFDVAQTDPIPGAPQPGEIAQRLTGADETGIYDMAAAALTARGWSVSREPIPGEVNGYTTTRGDRRVVVDAALSPAQAAKTILHEFGHVVLHAEPTRQGEHAAEPVSAHRGIRETEAESVAFVLAGLFGLDTADYSVGYVASWSDGNVGFLQETAGRVHAAVNEIGVELGLFDLPNDAEATEAA